MNCRVYLLTLFCLPGLVLGESDITKLLIGENENSAWIFGVTEEKREQYKKLEAKLEKNSQKEGINQKKLSDQIDEIQSKIRVAEEAMSKENPPADLPKQILLYQEIEQTLKDTIRARADLQQSMIDLKKTLEKFLHDPEFIAFKKEYKIAQSVSYSFDDLIVLYQKIQELELRISQLVEQEYSARAEIETHERASKAAQKELGELQTAITQKKDLNNASEADSETILQSKIMLAALHDRLSKLRLKQVEYRASVANHQAFVLRTQLHMLKAHVRSVKRIVHVSELDIARAQENLKQEQVRYYKEKDRLRELGSQIQQRKNEYEKQNEQLGKQLGIDTAQPLNWGMELADAPHAYYDFAHLGYINAKLQQLDVNKLLVEAYSFVADKKKEGVELNLSAKTSFQEISADLFFNEGDIAEETKKYHQIKADAKAVLALYREKMTTISGLTNAHKKNVETINQLLKKIEGERDKTFRGQENLYADTKNFFNLALEEKLQSIDSLAKLTSIYAEIIAELDSIIRLSNFILSELKTSTIWYRPAYAISWEGLTNAIPDIVGFLKDVLLYIKHLHPMHIFKQLYAITQKGILALVILISKLLLIFLFMFGAPYLHGEVSTIIARALKDHGMRKMALLSVAICGKFLAMHAQLIGGYLCCTVIVFAMPDLYLHTIFYLSSIPYFIYITRNFVTEFFALDAQQGYVIFPAELAPRLSRTLFLLVAITIALALFRQAFILSSFFIRSEVPTILLALNFIILQLSLIALISKDQLLKIIPETNIIWQTMHQIVDQYFYAILAVVALVIVMSNPYIGFGRLVFFVFTGIVYTAILIRLFLFLHSIVRSTTSYFMFATEAGVAKERFSHAKTLFGLVMVSSFLLLSFLVVISVAKVWGWPISVQDILQLMREPIMLKGTKNPITILSLLEIVGFVLIGFLFSYALEQFVFSKVFDLLLVEVGIQHTIIRITQYIVIAITIFIGFQNAGLEKIIGYAFTALALSIGWYIKDPISDFFAYFIILVQRPIKIGDFVRLDTEIEGVVRKITARSVVLRRKNSVMLVIPNSFVVQRVINNWNYIRTFIAFDDMRITISYGAEPEQVRALLLNVLNDHPRILKTPKPIVWLDQFGENGYVFLVRGFLSSTYTLDMWEIASEVRFGIVQALKKHNIQIAVPIRFVTNSPSISQQTKVVDSTTHVNADLK